MVPHGRSTTKTTRKKTSRRTTTTTKPTRRPSKKQHPQSQKLEAFSANSSSSSSKDSSKDSEVAEVSTISVCCSTPKGQKFKIPEISTCPPAPKKPRVLSNRSLRRSPLAFFAPLDLEVFFSVALRDVPVSFVRV
uniref:Uncharacterized protein n=1 Tax=Lotus japonicus TaxID=34305 RepID=I3SS27_LOTJA|nr:unknown [Lotus japonicus]